MGYGGLKTFPDSSEVRKSLQQDAHCRQERTSRDADSHLHAARRSILAASHCAVLRLEHRLNANADICQDDVTAYTEHD